MLALIKSRADLTNCHRNDHFISSEPTKQLSDVYLSPAWPTFQSFSHQFQWRTGLRTCVVVCCEIPLPEKVLVDPPSTNTWWQCPGENRQSPDSAALQLDPPLPYTETPHGQEGRGLATLKDHFLVYLSERRQMSAFVTAIWSWQTRRAMSAESRWRSPVRG